MDKLKYYLFISNKGQRATRIFIPFQKNLECLCVLLHFLLHSGIKKQIKNNKFEVWAKKFFKRYYNE